MSGISHEEFLDLGKTVMPIRMENMKELVGRDVDESYGQWMMKGTPNSSDMDFMRIGDRGYVYLYFNPHWIYQFHPDEWPLIEERLEESPFVKRFGSGVRVVTLLSEKKWDRHFSSRYEKYHEGSY